MAFCSVHTTVTFNSNDIVFFCMLLFYLSVLPVGFRVLGNLQLCVNCRLGGKSSSMYQVPDGSINRHTCPHTHTSQNKTTESLSKPRPPSSHTNNHFYPHSKSGTHRAAGVKTILCSLAVCVSCLKIICPQDCRKKKCIPSFTQLHIIPNLWCHFFYDTQRTILKNLQAALYYMIVHNDHWPASSKKGKAP